MSDAPTFRGTRVLVRTLFEYLEAGHSIERFLEGFPTVSRGAGSAPPADVATFAGAVALALLMTLAGSLLPGLCAVRVDPTVAIRVE